MIRRIIAGVGANSFGMAVSIAMQLGSLPLFLHYWDTANYGTWLMVSAIPSYLSMADAGMVTAAGNQMAMDIGAGQISHANRLFQSAQCFMTLLCGGLALLLLPLWLLASRWHFEHFTADPLQAVILLSLGVLIALFGGLCEAAFKATGRYATGSLTSTLVRLAEWAGGLVGLVLVGTLSAVALGSLLMRFLGTLCTIAAVRHGEHGLRWGLGQAQTKDMRDMLKPALSFMAFPLANALNFQGITLLVGALFGPVLVALFSSYRTLARVAVQATAIFSHAIWPEFSRLFGANAWPELHRAYRNSAWAGALQAALLSGVLYALAPWLLRIWSHGAIAFVPSLMQLMLCYAAIAGFWHVPRVFLMSTNQHTTLAAWSLVGGGLCVGLAWSLSRTLEVNGIALAMLLAELAIAAVCFDLARKAVRV